jgi:hypothetical protein
MPKVMFEDVLRMLHGDAKVDAYLDRLRVEQEAHDAAEALRVAEAERAWNAAYDAGDWATRARMDAD